MKKLFKISEILILINIIIGIQNLENHQNKNANEFTQTINHQLHKISGGILSPDKQYIIFVDRKWNRDAKTSYSNIKYATINGESIRDLTPPLTNQSDSSPVFSQEFKDRLLFLRNVNGTTQIYQAKWDPEATTHITSQLTNYPLDVSNIKFESNVIVFSTEVYYDCDDMDCTAKKNKEVEARGENTYREYTELMIRHWDHWYTEGKADHPFYQKVRLEDDILVLDGSPVDMLLHEKACSPPIENGPEQFSIMDDGSLISFAVHQKNYNMSFNTKWDIYVYNVETGDISVITKTEQGRCQNPKFSSKETNKIAYLCMPRNGLESDQLHLRVYDLTNDELIEAGYTGKYRQFPTDFIWEDMDNFIFLMNTIEYGHTYIYRYDHTQLNESEAFIRLTNDSYAFSSIALLDDNEIFASFSSYKHPEVLGVVKEDETSNYHKTTVIIDLNKEELSNYEMSDEICFNFTGAKDEEVQGWLFKPTNFEEDKKYPLAFLVHGGPENAWEPAWSYRWNPQLWTNHGFAVVMINFHGSNGMGIDFQDAIRNNWGGYPFEDLMKGFEHLKTYDWIDMDRVGGCGASYGGFMINWIQGHNDDGKFKCLVTHDGVFNTITMFYATEELWFPMSEYCPHDKWGCNPFDDEELRKGFEIYNPERFIDHWKTPHLIIHGSLDFRIPITEGVSAFAALQMRNIPSRFIHYPLENHWVLNAENSIKWYDEVLGWLDKYTK